MSEFKIKPQRVRSAAQDMNSIARQMKHLEEQIRDIQRGLSFEVAQKQRIRQRLKAAGNDAAAQYRGLYGSSSALNTIVNTYETTEQRLAGSKVVRYDIIKDTALPDIKDVITIGDGGLGILGPAFGTFIATILPPARLLLDLAKLFTSAPAGYEKYKEETKYGVGKKTLAKFGREKGFGFEFEELKKSDIKPFKVLDKTWKDTKSAFHAEATAGDEAGTHIGFDFDVLKREVSSELYAGLYYKDPVTGKKKLRAAAGGSVGFTMSALSASALAQLGDSNFGGYVKGEASAGKVEAKADGVMGLRDADGKFNPTLHGKLSAEAIAAEASVKGGVKVLGADVGVKASVNVGVGAHAEAGFKDGVFSLELGASLGFGGSVKLDIDVGGTVEAISGAAKTVWNRFSGWFR